MNHVVALSGGKDSTAMALRLRETCPAMNFTYVCTPTGDEVPELWAHWKELENLLGKPLIYIRAKKDLNELIEHFKALPNWRQRWCTRMLKIEPYRAWLLNHLPAISYVGLRADEPERHGADFQNIPNVEVKFPMREWGWGISEVRRYLQTRAVDVPQRTDCARCFFQRLPEWQDLWERHPDIYASAEAQETTTGHTFRSPSRDSYPASLADMRKEFESGRLPVYQRDLFAKTKCRVCSL